METSSLSKADAVSSYQSPVRVEKRNPRTVIQQQSRFGRNGALFDIHAEQAEERRLYRNEQRLDSSVREGVLQLHPIEGRNRSRSPGEQLALFRPFRKHRRAYAALLARDVGMQRNDGELAAVPIGKWHQQLARGGQSSNKGQHTERRKQRRKAGPRGTGILLNPLMYRLAPAEVPRSVGKRSAAADEQAEPLFPRPRAGVGEKAPAMPDLGLPFALPAFPVSARDQPRSRPNQPAGDGDGKGWLRFRLHKRNLAARSGCAQLLEQRVAFLRLKQDLTTAAGQPVVLAGGTLFGERFFFGLPLGIDQPFGLQPPQR